MADKRYGTRVDMRVSGHKTVSSQIFWEDELHESADIGRTIPLTHSQAAMSAVREMEALLAKHGQYLDMQVIAPVVQERA